MVSVMHTQVMGQLVLGGTSGISMGSLSLQLEGVARQFKLVIPPYFALVLRAFSVIEGIAMAADPDYAIVANCFPYLCTRLINDNHPRMRAALKQLLYGHGTRLDKDRLQSVFSALGAFATPKGQASQGITFSDALGGGDEMVKGTMRVRRQGRAEDAVIDDNIKQVLKVVFSRKGNYMQVHLLPWTCAT
jgi:aarF domain-containing kinase